MRLIVIARFVNRIEIRDAVLQEVRRISCAFDLMNSAAGHSRHLKEAPLFSSCRQFLRLAEEDGAYQAILRNQPVMYEPFHEGFRVFKIWIFPRGTIQPKGPARCVRQSHVISIPEMFGLQQWHECASLKRMANHSPCAGQSAVVAFVSGPRTVREVLPSCLVTTISQ